MVLTIFRSIKTVLEFAGTLISARLFLPSGKSRHAEHHMVILSGGPAFRNTLNLPLLSSLLFRFCIDEQSTIRQGPVGIYRSREGGRKGLEGSGSSSRFVLMIGSPGH